MMITDPHTHYLTYYLPGNPSPVLLSPASSHDEAVSLATSHAVNHPGRLIFVSQVTHTVVAPPTEAIISTYSTPIPSVTPTPDAPNLTEESAT